MPIPFKISPPPSVDTAAAWSRQAGEKARGRSAWPSLSQNLHGAWATNDFCSPYYLTLPLRTRLICLYLSWPWTTPGHTSRTDAPFEKRALLLVVRVASRCLSLRVSGLISARLSPRNCPVYSFSFRTGILYTIGLFFILFDTPFFPLCFLETCIMLFYVGVTDIFELKT